MGTNYYARIIPSKERKEQLKHLIDSDNFDSIKEVVSKMYGESTEYQKGAEIHLGKRSAGWKFLFNPNYERYYDLTKESLMKFLSKPDIIIYSEYFNSSNGKLEYTDDPDANHKTEYLWTPQQFMDMAINWGQKDGWDGESYEKWEINNNKNHFSTYLRYGDSKELYWRNKGYNPSYYNFYNDGLRWSTYCEFS